MWITLTTEMLQAKLAAAEYASITTAQVPSGSSAAAILAEELGNTTQMVRGYVAAYAANLLGDGDTVPEELKDASLVILRHKVLTRLPGLRKLLDEGRVREYDQALSLLKDVAAGRFRLVQPTVAAEDQAGGSTVVVVRKPTRRNTRETWGGTI